VSARAVARRGLSPASPRPRCVLGQVEQTLDLAAFASVDAVHQNAHISRVDPMRERRSLLDEARAVFAEVEEVLEGEDGPAFIETDMSSRPNANPIHLSGDSVSLGLRTDAADADDRVERPSPNASHAAMNAEASQPIGIARVCPLVDEGPHSLRLVRAVGRRFENSVGGFCRPCRGRKVASASQLRQAPS